MHQRATPLPRRKQYLDEDAIADNRQVMLHKMTGRLLFATPYFCNDLFLLLLLLVTFTGTLSSEFAKTDYDPFLSLQSVSKGFGSEDIFGSFSGIRHRFCIDSALKPVFLGLEKSLSASLARRAFKSIRFNRQTNQYDIKIPLTSIKLPNARGGGQVKTEKPKTKGKKKEKAKRSSKSTSILSASECFVQLDDIADLTLRDVGTVFDYAVKSTRADFDEGVFLNGISPEVKPVVEAMDKATSISRGRNLKSAITGTKGAVPGDIETFNFCAAMRILSEWRVLRQVPQGKQYKQYATSMSLARKDVIQNIAKIEHAASSWINNQMEMPNSETTESRSPTLRHILQFEKDLGVHSKLPKLKDGTGSMGLLWNWRGLSFHVNFFEKLLEVPKRFPTAKDAVMAAYQDVFGGVHGWALRKMFIYYFQEAPQIEEVYKIMNPRHLRKVMESASHTGHDDPMEKQTLTHPDNMIDRVNWEFKRLVDSAGQCGPRLVECYHPPQEEKVQLGSAIESDESLTGDELDQYITEEMEKEAHEHINSYLEVTRPILSDLANLYDEFNMDDPTKV